MKKVAELGKHTVFKINKEFYPPTYEDKGVEYDTYFPTEEDVAQLRRYINTVNQLETGIDLSLSTIINDEVMAYFAGEKTLDECFSLIQNRASLWISEQS